MKLSSVLTSIKGSNGEKTASVSPSQEDRSEKSATASTSARLKEALKEAAAPAQEKVASAGSPIEDLTKIASQVASAEHEALVKEAQLYGAAVCDGFMARAAQYEAAGAKVASVGGVKTAGENDSFEKFASENPELVKEAAELGFQTASAQIEKLASAAYDKGYDEATLTVYKLGHASFVQGFEDIANILQAASK
jgi:hypothetical protein